MPVEPSAEAGRVGGLIPHFFFDAIGRIVPGGFLIAGLAYELWDRPWMATLKAHVPNAGPVTSALSFLVFLGASFIGGFLLGAASHLVERAWARIQPWSADSIRKRYGFERDKKSALERRLDEKFSGTLGSGQMERALIRQASLLCAYYVWGTNPNLGVLTSRWDAEALASRSLLFASLGLAAYGAVLGRWHSLVFFAICGIGAFFANGYHREKQVLGRFDLFLACTACEEHQSD